ncbi:dipeptide ABC transporter ATP-binding protein [Chachezhania antarctica]|uniref:dipeptide ABC transporter ATP-binding protein n=1 Tax=Chachezhania antarctica TaxID=2340860 RepID=UPI000EB2988A|nr:ABC transporter ATP-binding protein [Chachezhania antarctica]|tara:strand:+ start:4648 stop:6249 length:1602 start_codon:yes stop_codon:yes gene_type:complete
MSLLSLENLHIQVGHDGAEVVQDLSFTLEPGRMMALVGESGSGKTMAARSILGLLPPPMRLAKGAIRFDGVDLAGLGPKALTKYRGARIGMVFQEPMTSLNPAMPIGRQMEEGLRLHLGLSRVECRKRILKMLERIRIADPEHCLAAYPHEFSGGMRQRIMLASVMLLKPQLLIADEPTTALDTLVQHDVMNLMTELAAENGTAVLLISHDLGMVSHYIEDVVVLQHGIPVERGRTTEVLTQPSHAYTQRLVDALPRRSAGGLRNAEPKPALVELQGITVDYPGHALLFGRRVAKRAVDGVDLVVGQGETLGLVGASGSGKTTIGRAIVGLEPISGGTMRFKGQPLVPDDPDTRRDLQIIFQDPYSSLDPRQRVEAIVGEPLKLDTGLTRKDRRERVREVCDEVGLPAGFLTRFPHQLSGGQRQRVAIARAIVRRPAFVVADEPVSALDMTVQKQILELIRQLQMRHGFGCLFVSHDLGAVEQVADRVAVIETGKIVETGTRDDIFDRPQAEYTRRLLNAAMLLGRSYNAAVS